MGNTYGYMRISTKEERGKQKYTRQEQALARFQKEHNTEILLTFRDDASGKNFDRPEWQRLEKIVQPGDTIVFKDICRFTREYERGFLKYMDLLNKGINLIFIDNNVVSTPYIKSMMDIAEEQSNRIARKSLRDTIELLLLVELDRAEQEREITVKRIKDGIAASNKRSGRVRGQLDKMSAGLKSDIETYLSDRTIKQVDLMKKHEISRNTLKKYIRIVQTQKLNMHF